MTNRYYDIKEDLQLYPEAWCILAWSARSCGKTYSTLKRMVEDEKIFCFLKRTIVDIDMLCMDGDAKGVKFDVSPFKPLNRDLGWNIKPVKIKKGFAGFYHCNEDGKPTGAPIGYAAALSASKDIKGFDMSEVDFLIFDEFIPKKHERINRTEGEALLEIYMTLRRDRLERGLKDLVLICIANATNVSNPTFNTLDVIDDAVQLQINGQEYLYLDYRGILLHRIPTPEAVADHKSGIERAMEGTAWADMAFSGNFAFDDFSNVKHNRLKGYRPWCAYSYKKRTVYIYEKDGRYYATGARANIDKIYNLDRENEQKKFWYDYVCDLRDECIEDRMLFESYTMYDLIVNYKKIFEI